MIVMKTNIWTQEQGRLKGDVSTTPNTALSSLLPAQSLRIYKNINVKTNITSNTHTGADSKQSKGKTTNRVSKDNVKEKTKRWYL